MHFEISYHVSEEYQAVAWIFVGIWVILVLEFVAFNYFNKNASLKRKIYLTLLIASVVWILTSSYATSAPAYFFTR